MHVVLAYTQVTGENNISSFLLMCSVVQVTCTSACPHKVLVIVYLRYCSPPFLSSLLLSPTLSCYAGMSDALPADVQSLLRRKPAVASPQITAPLALDIEARDPRMASDIILQMLAYKPTPQGVPNAPQALTCLYFTLQFYHFPPFTTEPALLASAASGESGDDAHILLPMNQVGRAACGVQQHTLHM